MTARNPAQESENRIHGDDVARGYGFQGGLVPGVTVYSYACGAIVEALGEKWVESGGARVRFVAPCYDGEELTVDVRLRHDRRWDVSASVGERVCATGEAWLGAGSSVGAGSGVGDVRGSIPFEAPPTKRPEVSEEALTIGRVLGSVAVSADASVVAAYVEVVCDPRPDLYAEKGWVHPGMLLQGANRVLTANAVLPAWLHVESDVQHRRAALAGEPISVRARVAEAFERKGHSFVVVDVEWVDPEGDLVASARHAAIWRLARRAPA